jgi:hypothetical protein
MYEAKRAGRNRVRMGDPDRRDAWEEPHSPKR